MSALPNRLFVTGTDTDVGKTVVSALIMAGRGGYYWKPVQSGTVEGTDTATVRAIAGLAAEHCLPEAYSLRQPLSPHEAAEFDGVRIDPARLALPDIPEDEPLVVEGAGGIMVPLAPGLLTLDFMRALALPVLVVARSGLGTINHTLLTVQAIRHAGLEVAGVIMNGPRKPANRQAIEDFGGARVLAELEPLAELTPESLRRAYEKMFRK